MEKLGNKTPKMILNELCVKKGLTLECRSTEVTKLPSLFKCVCTVFGNGFQAKTAEGEGPTKKEAEHAAAVEIIPQIANAAELLQVLGMAKASLGNSIGNGGQRSSQIPPKRVAASVGNASPARPSTDDGDEDFLSDVEDGLITGEPIGELTTICQRHGFRMAQYEEDHKRGPENTNIFTVTCTLPGKVSKSGRRLKKTDAKKVAAFKVVRKLKEEGFTADKVKVSVASKLFSTPTKTATAAVGEVSSSNPSPVNQNKGSLPTILRNTISEAIRKQEEKINMPRKRNVREIGSSSGTVQSKDVDDDAFKDKHVDATVRDLKRKLYQDDANFAVTKKQFQSLSLTKLGCHELSETCLQFVKDYTHVFMHIPVPDDDSLEKNLLPENLKKFLNDHGGAARLLQESAISLNLQLYFSTSIKLKKEGLQCCFLTMKFPVDPVKNVPKTQVVHGVGGSNEEAMHHARIEALKFIRLMLFKEP